MGTTYPAGGGGSGRGGAHRAGAGEWGVHLIEYGLLLFPLLFVIFGALEGGRMLYVYNQLNDAVRQGAREGVARYTELPEGTSTSSIINAAARSAVDGAVAARMSCTTTRDSNATGPGGLGGKKLVEVTCQYDFQTAVSFLPFSQTFTVTSRMYAPR